MSVSVLMSGQQTVVADLLPVGTIAKLSNVLKIYSGSEWLPCNGAAYTRTAPAYAQLYSVIGTTFGNGDGVTTFNVPTRDQAKNRPLLSFTASNTFAPFEDDTDVVVDNNGAVIMDIDAGAVIAGVRLSINNKNVSGGIVDIRTNAADASQKALLPRGLIVLEWDGTQWCLVGQTVKIRMQFTSNTTWKTPFAACYRLMPVGGGGGGGNGGSNNPYASGGAGGGGGGGGASIFELAKAAGTTLTITIGGGGGVGSSGGNTVITDGTTSVTGAGGGGGGNGGPAGMSGSTTGVPGTPGTSGSGGSTTGLTGQIVVRGNGGSGQTGGTGAWGVGNNGGSGGGSNANGSSGGAGRAFIEY